MRLEGVRILFEGVHLPQLGFRRSVRKRKITQIFWLQMIGPIELFSHALILASIIKSLQHAKAVRSMKSSTNLKKLESTSALLWPYV